MTSFSYLYIAEECEKDFNGNLVPTKNVKIGKTADELYERLRKLNQGNKRKLRFIHLWIGCVSEINWLEAKIKKKYFDDTEWIDCGTEQLHDMVIDTLKNECSDYSVYKVTYRFYMPYTYKSKGTLRKISHDRMYCAAKVANGRVFDADNIGNIWYRYPDGSIEQDVVPYDITIPGFGYKLPPTLTFLEYT